ncbi:TonB-dependent receptor [Granulicella sp. L60]|uniref:TonB-dependent receptor n=1 Tax=Granulicella sp. L60 TaxID=1641866 RepID=UPI00131A7DE1|nr:TonB-dependent receptor [Granulicella sp. L60]
MRLRNVVLSGAKILSRYVGMALLLAVFIPANSIFAQISTGALSGTVYDQSSRGVVSASVTVKNLGTGLTRNVVTRDDGSYLVAELPVGSYSITIGSPGFATASIQNIVITVARQSVQDVSLAVGSATESVVVNSEEQLTDTTNPSLGGFVSPEKMEDIPLNGRNFVDLAFLQPGINKNTNLAPQGGTTGEWFSSNGLPDRSNNQLLDGASVVSIQGGAGSSILSTSLGVDGIQEFRVINGFAGAEYGGVLGAQLVMVSKGGTNAFHGDAYDFVRNDALDAKSPLLLSTQPKQSFQRNQFGGALGGPIVKNRLFTETVLEVLLATQPQTGSSVSFDAGCVAQAGAQLTNAQCSQLKLPSSTPSITVNPVSALLLPALRPPAGTNGLQYSGSNFSYSFPLPQQEFYGQERVDYTLGANDTAFARFTSDHATVPVLNSFPYFYYDILSKGNIGTISETHIFSPKLLSTVGFSYTGIDVSATCTAQIPGGYELVAGAGMGSISIAGSASFGPCSSDTRSRKLLYSLRDDLVYDRGINSVKFGVLYVRDVPTISSPQNARGSFTFPSLADFVQGNSNGYTFHTAGPRYYPAFRQNEFGFYAQDDIKLTRRLVLNVGLRYEPWTMPTERNGQSAFINNDPLVDPNGTFQIGPLIASNPALTNFGPRIGLAWDIFGSGKTALRAGYNRLYDLEPLNSTYNNYSVGTPPFSGAFSTSNVAQATYTYRQGLPIAGVSNATETGLLPFPTPANAWSNYGIALYAQPVGHNIKQPTADIWTLSVQQQLPLRSVLTLSYVGDRGTHLIQSLDINPNVRQVVNGQDYWPSGATRINKQYTSINQNGTTGDSNYNAFEANVNYSASPKLQYQMAYTWSRAIDNVQGVVGAESAASPLEPADSYNTRLDRGPAIFDATQNLHVNAIYHLPDIKGHGGIVRTFTNGWWVSPILAVQSGLPFTPTIAINNSRSGVGNNGSGGVDRPSYVTSANLAAALLVDPNATVYRKSSVIQHSRTQYFNPHMFTVGPAGYLGTAGRDSLRGPGLLDLDFAVNKDTPLRFLGEKGALELRAEIFNVPNHVNYGEPNGSVWSSATAINPNAGLITSLINPTQSSWRDVQLAVKVLF